METHMYFKSLYNKDIELFKFVKDGRVIRVGKATEKKNGGFRKKVNTEVV